MAVIVFDNDGGGGTGVWSLNTNWVGNALPGPLDTADINEDCALDVSDIVAQLDILATKTLTMGAGNDITGMTASCLGAGLIVMGAGCQLTWDTASNRGLTAVDLRARGTSGNRCLVDNVGAGAFDTGLASNDFDCEYTDIHSVEQLRSTGYNRYIGCDIEGRGAGNSWFLPNGGTIIIKDSWISNFVGTVGGGWIGYSHGSYVQIENVTYGEDIDGNAQANANDWEYPLDGNNKGMIIYARNVQHLSATRIQWSKTAFPSSRIFIDNYGYNPLHTNGTGPGSPGIGFTDSPLWSAERNTAAKKAGDYGMRVTPRAGIDTDEATLADMNVYIPIKTGDDISVSIFGRRHTMTNDCAEVEIDPEGAWFTPDTSAPALTDDTWTEFAPSAAGAGGAADEGMVRIVLRLKEYEAAAYMDWADMVVTVT